MKGCDVLSFFLPRDDILLHVMSFLPPEGCLWHSLNGDDLVRASLGMFYGERLSVPPSSGIVFLFDDFI